MDDILFDSYQREEMETMAEQWQIHDAVRHLKLVGYLLSKANDRYMTHSEKRHIHEVAGMELLEALHLLGEDGASMSRNTNADITDAVSDLPF